MRLNSFWQTLVRYGRKGWFITLLGLAAVALLIWFGGPMVAIAGYEPLASVSARMITLLLLVICWGAWYYIRGIRERQSHHQAVEELLSNELGEQQSSVAQHDITVLRERIQKALDILKHASFGQSKDTYHLPWYMLIGPPGSGKTTTLHNSGLEFPLREQMGVDSIEGIGGTRQCDWWFTNKAVFIDTAGRYTTQDSHNQQDAGAWKGFLGLLRKYRPKRPINGVIVFASLAELLKQTRTERNLHARAIKQRIQELQSQLGMTFPVYMLLTKADLIAGFSEFFDDLSAEETEQVWGMTFRPEQASSEQGEIALFNKEFHTMLKRLQMRLFHRLQYEHGVENRSAIFEFPRQLRSAQSAADDFLKEIFSPNPFEKPIMLRGIYVVSATQQGIPIDQISPQLSHDLQLAELPKRQLTGEGKGFFIKKVFDSIIVPERELASVNLRHHTKVKWLRHGAMAFTALGTVVLSSLWLKSYQWNLGLVAKVTDAVTQYQASSTSQLSVSDDLYALNERLQVLRALPAGYDGHLPGGGPRDMGLYQGGKLGQSARRAYQNALVADFGPFLAKAMADEMQSNARHRDYLYETLRSYLMLFKPAHFDAEHIQEWFRLYLNRQLSSELHADLRQQLELHLHAYLHGGISGLAYDSTLVSQVREDLMNVPLAERAYQRIKTELLQSHIPDFALADVLGSDSLRVVTRNSGQSLQQGIPGLFTYQGFHGLFNVQKNRIIRQLMEDSWVYGEDETINARQVDSALTTMVNQKYYQDYIQYWQALLQDISIVSFDTLEHGLFVTRTLSGHEQPIQRIIQAVQSQVQLTEQPESEEMQLAADVAGRVARTQFSTQYNRMSRLLPDELPNLNRNKLPGQEVEATFSSLLSIKAEHFDHMANVLRSNHEFLEQLYQPGNMARQAYMNRLQNRDSNQMNLTLRRLREDIPAPFSDWVSQIYAGSSVLIAEGSKQHINEAWRGTVLTEFNRSIANRYPINRASSDEIKIRDFERFFGYGGTLDEFFNEYLRPFVNMQRAEWSFKQDIGINPSVLRTFQRAHRIRQAFFDEGSQSMKVGFNLRPIFLDQHITHLLLEIDGQSLSYRHGPPRNQHFEWPGDRNRQQTRLVFTPANSGLPTSRRIEGEWSWFRFLDEQTRLRPETRQDGLLYVSEQSNKAQIQILPDSVNNPFWNSDLEGFRCPVNL
ncbi:type VI secretion system membrane subunit TssM [Alkalimonas amylolytica]|uniref:Type VI secretion system protein ImpL n=1 Tax=Alkalimonas amylolytica TaxID=152573 RepID=A0A1H3Z4Z0_ALKAM|nr:type VI secretion system membrane subunit TssM [Alkalimonas amylolytica]SEA18451.1 type VI secretion system protein ImpL [Alkalimonas amylolytica]